MSCFVDGEDDVESRGAIGVRVVGDELRDSAAFDVEGERLFGEIGQTGELSFSIAVSAELQIGLAHVHEAVAKLDGDLGVVEGFVRAVADGEAGGAGADAAVDFVGNLRSRLRRSLGRRGRTLGRLILRINAKSGTEENNECEAEDLQGPNTDVSDHK